MATCSSNVPKRRLGNTSIYRTHYQAGKTHSYFSLTWTIPIPLSLKDGVLYGKEVKEVALTFVKCKKSLTFWIVGKLYFTDVQCRIIRDKNRADSSFLLAEKISHSKYKMECKEVLCDCENQLLKEGILMVQFKFGPRFGRRIHPNTLRGFTSMNSQQNFTFDLFSKVELEDGFFSDFVAHVEEKKFYTHKAIMAIRSPYLRNFIKDGSKDEEIIQIEFDTTCDTFTSVVGFLYFGAVKMKDVDSVIRIMELAVSLNVSQLVFLAALWLEKNMDKSNVNRIRRAAIENGIGLTNSADTYLKKYDN